MKRADWLVEVPSEITNDPIGKLEVFRLALYVGSMIPYQRKYALREEQAEYNTSAHVSDFSLDSEIPIL